MFGCDICQDVCPWNRFSKATHEKRFKPNPLLLEMKTNEWHELNEEVFNQLNILIEGHLRKRGSGEITIPKTGIKLRRIKKKATKARVMFSPLTGQEVKLNAKPARLSVKLTALKFLKEVVDRQ